MNVLDSHGLKSVIQKDSLKILFIINPAAGNTTTNWAVEISNYFSTLNHTIQLYVLTKACTIQTIKDKINAFKPHQVVAVGGDGTVKMVAECLIHTNISLGILPAGSANGLAKELGISENPEKALAVLVTGRIKKIHITMINNHLCIHLSDIGLNAYAMKKFRTQHGRGMWGYFIASLRVLLQNPKMQIKMQIGDKIIKIKAEMVVIANATQYGTGAVINPIGQLDDTLFEVIVIKQISFLEVFKMVFSHEPYDTDKTEIFQTNQLSMQSVKKVHFQVDGEYLGKIKTLNAALVPHALQVIVPQ
jgi:diacylglycerol kinase (ATP)